MGRGRRRRIRQFKQEAEILEQTIEEQEQIRENIPGVTTDQWIEQNAKIQELFRQLNILWEKIYEYQRAENTERILKSGYSISQDNSTREQLRSNTRTTLIMDKFSNSEKQFLIFHNQFHIPHPTYNFYSIPVSLVVTKMPDRPNYIGETNEINCVYNKLTMSILKSKARMRISSEILERIPDDDRAHGLYQEILAVTKQNVLAGGYFPFKKPHELGGQTYEEQSGFGWEYSGPNLVREGRQYGETKKFLIIGIYRKPR